MPLKRQLHIEIGAVAITPEENAHFTLAPYNTDGSLDSTFAADGKQIIDFASGFSKYYFCYVWQRPNGSWRCQKIIATTKPLSCDKY